MFPASDSPPSGAQFVLLADAEPGVLPRVLGTLARRHVVPDEVRVTRDGEFFAIRIHIESLTPEARSSIEKQLCQIVGARADGVRCILGS